MKLQKLVATSVLATLGLGLVAPQALALEEATFIKGNGTVTFEENDDPTHNGEDVEDPENPGTEVVPEPGEGENNNDKKGTLRVDFVSNLKFDKQKITTGKGEYFATPTNVVLKNEDNTPGETVQRGNFVNITDKRASDSATTAAKGWVLNAEMTKGFTSSVETGESVLKGANITFTNPFVNSTQDEVNYPTAFSSVVLQQGETMKMASADAGKGWGSYSIEYGRPEVDGQAATMGESVKLTVPAETPLLTTAYTAEITWTIAAL